MTKLCLDTISNWVHKCFVVYVTPNHPLGKYAVRLPADGVSKVRKNVREVNIVIFCDRMHFRALCVTAISVSTEG